MSDPLRDAIKQAVLEALQESGLVRQPADGPRLMRVDAVAAYLDCTPAHVHHLIARGVFKPVRWPLADGSEGRTIWLDRQDVEHAIEERKHAA